MPLIDIKSVKSTMEFFCLIYCYTTTHFLRVNNPCITEIDIVIVLLF